jgi:hypothetical protein
LARIEAVMLGHPRLRNYELVIASEAKQSNAKQEDWIASAFAR